MKYDYWVTTQEIVPPIGGVHRFAAHAEIREIDKGAVAHNLGETWGKTKEEAESKMQEKIQAWLQNQ